MSSRLAPTHAPRTVFSRRAVETISLLPFNHAPRFFSSAHATKSGFTATPSVRLTLDEKPAELSWSLRSPRECSYPTATIWHHHPGTPNFFLSTAAISV